MKQRYETTYEKTITLNYSHFLSGVRFRERKSERNDDRRCVVKSPDSSTISNAYRELSLIRFLPGIRLKIWHQRTGALWCDLRNAVVKPNVANERPNDDAKSPTINTLSLVSAAIFHNIVWSTLTWQIRLRRERERQNENSLRDDKKKARLIISRTNIVCNCIIVQSYKLFLPQNCQALSERSAWNVTYAHLSLVFYFMFWVSNV